MSFASGAILSLRFVSEVTTPTLSPRKLNTLPTLRAGRAASKSRGHQQGTGTQQTNHRAKHPLPAVTGFANRKPHHLPAAGSKWQSAMQAALPAARRR